MDWLKWTTITSAVLWIGGKVLFLLARAHGVGGSIQAMNWLTIVDGFGVLTFVLVLALLTRSTYRKWKVSPRRLKRPPQSK